MADRPQVLIVEDEPVVLKVAGMALAAHGIGYREATDVPAAAALLDSTSFQVVLTDLKLPGQSGFEMLKLAQELSPSPQVVLITGYATIDNALLSFERGSFDFIPKPFDVEELVSVVTRALRFARRREAALQVPEDRYFLGRHSWAQLDPDGTATVGVAETIAGQMGQLDAIDYQESREHAVQGQCICQLASVDGLNHRVWAPLSGRIIALNSDLAGDLDLINRDPFASGWLARVIPTSLEKELPNLRQRHDSASS